MIKSDFQLLETLWLESDGLSLIFRKPRWVLVEKFASFGKPDLVTKS